LRLAIVALFACLFAASWTLKSDAQQPTTAAQPQRPQPSPNTPAEQVFTNIQVLKGMPSDQLSATMDVFATSLGVNCGFCHARNAAGNGLDFASDAKEEKKTARAMIQMQMDVNTHHLAAFDGDRISCFTCHQGHAGAPHMPRLPLALPSPPPGAGPGTNSGTASGQPAAPGGQPAAAGAPAQGGQQGGQGGGQQQPPRPTAEQVLAKYVAAVGGDAASKLKTLVMHGTREGARGGAAPYEVTVAPPDRLYVVATIPAQGQQAAGEVRQGINGASGGWTTNARGARALNASELADLRNVSRYLMPIKIGEPFPQMRLLGRTRVGDTPTWVLEAKPAPDVRQLFFFDQQTGLLLRQLIVRSLFLQDVPEQVDYEDYRDVDGVKIPFTVRTSGINPNNPTTIRKFTEIKANVAVDDAIFAMPATPKP
jgi:hypothetical protein